MNLESFLLRIDSGNRIWDILEIEHSRSSLQIVIKSRQEVPSVKSIVFDPVANFTASLFGAAGDSQQLPQSLIGFDYWLNTEDAEVYQWEIDGDECTWNFSARIPKMTNIK